MADNLDSEKQNLISNPSFIIRAASPEDALAIQSFNEHFIQHSMLAIGDHHLQVSEIKTSMSKLDDEARKVLVYLIAVPPRSDKRVSRLTAAFRKLSTSSPTDRQSDETRTAQLYDMLGTVMMYPLHETLQGMRQGYTTCFDRTAYMRLLTMDESALGVELHYAVTVALIEGVLSKAREQCVRFKTVIIEDLFREDQPILVTRRNILLELGFEQVGLLKEVAEKGDLLFDRMIMQRAI